MRARIGAAGWKSAVVAIGDDRDARFVKRAVRVELDETSWSQEESSHSQTIGTREMKRSACARTTTRSFAARTTLGPEAARRDEFEHVVLAREMPRPERASSPLTPDLRR